MIFVKMLDYALIFSFLTACYRNSVYFTWNRIKLAESTFSYYFLIKSSRQWKTAVGSAKAVHFGKPFVSGQGNMIVWLFCKKPEESCRSCSCLCHNEIDVICQAVSSFVSAFLIISYTSKKYKGF